MNIVIERRHRNLHSIDGALRINGSPVICHTAEATATALSSGTYPVIIHRCKHYRRKMPCLVIDDQVKQQMENRSGRASTPMSATEHDCSSCPKMEYVCHNSTLPLYCPMIKIGNGVHNRNDGSIIIGERIIWGCMKHPVRHFNRLIDRLDKAQSRGETITLTIEEHYPKPHNRELTKYESGTQILNQL